MTSWAGEPGQGPPEREIPPLGWIVLKVVQRCNLNCTYCYVYNRGDDSWAERPNLISDEVAVALAGRIREQCATYSLDEFVIELHGGEPLLLGKRRMRHLVELLRRECAGVHLKVIMQTNGLLLDHQWLELFDELGITFGLSLDGPAALADRFRVRLDGRGSTEELLAKVHTLRAASPLFDRTNTGVLCVANPDADGGALVRWFSEQGFRAFDFLLPDGNYANLPPGWRGAEPYRRFLVSAFEEWYGMGKAAPRIRTFEVMIRAFMGERPVLDALGGDLRALCVVETDGSIGISDVARICGGKFSRDTLNVFEHRLDMHAEGYGLDEIQAPCDSCRRCPYVDNVGGGFLPHRFDGASFDNPSIYCPALCGLAEVIYEHLREDVPGELWKVKVDVAG